MTESEFLKYASSGKTYKGRRVMKGLVAACIAAIAMTVPAYPQDNQKNSIKMEQLNLTSEWDKTFPKATE